MELYEWALITNPAQGDRQRVQQNASATES